MKKHDSVSLYRMRRLINDLANIRGRGTELISLYIPSGRPIHDVINTLKEEYSTASNIKSDSTRANVQGALTKIIQRLKLYNRVPENGLAIFCGAVPKPGKAQEEFVLYEVLPHKPINTFLYRCDDHFHIEILRELIKEEEAIGIISIDSSEAGLGVVSGSQLLILDELTSGVGSKHRQGGQSARRFERLREAELKGFFRRVAEHAQKAFIEEYPVKRLIISGPGPTKEEFLKGEYLDYRLQKSVIGVIDTSYAGEEGVRETLERAKNLLRDTRLVEEKTLVSNFLREASKPEGLAVYGLQRVLEALSMGAVDTVIVSEDVGITRVEFECGRCGYRKEVFTSQSEYYKKLSEETKSPCPKCKAVEWSYKTMDLVDYLYDKAQETGARVEVISPKTEHGSMFKSFGGVGAILRYKLRRG